LLSFSFRSQWLVMPGWRTKGDLLRYAIAFALRSVRLAGRKLGLSEDQRYEIAGATLVELRKHGEWRELDEVMEPPVGHT
jgi:hypothetical protein